MKSSKCILFLLVVGTLSGCYPVATVSNAPEYSGGAEYYYYPDEEVYYYPSSSQYIYYDGGSWTYAAALPPRYTVNLYSTNHVVLNYQGRDPYRYHSKFRREYPRGYQAQNRTRPPREISPPRPSRRTETNNARLNNGQNNAIAPGRPLKPAKQAKPPKKVRPVREHRLKRN